MTGRRALALLVARRTERLTHAVKPLDWRYPAGLAPWIALMQQALDQSSSPEQPRQSQPPIARRHEAAPRSYRRSDPA